MACSNTGAVLLALVAAVILPSGVTPHATSDVIDDDLLVAQYDRTFPQHRDMPDRAKIDAMTSMLDTDVMDDDLLVAQYDRIFPPPHVMPDQIKIDVITSMMNVTEIEFPVSKDQDRVAREAVDLLKRIESADSEEEKDRLKAELDGMETRMLKAGMVIAEEYKKDPEYWDKKLDEYANSEERTITVGDKTDAEHATHDSGWAQNTGGSEEPAPPPELSTIGWGILSSIGMALGIVMYLRYRKKGMSELENMHVRT